FFFYSERRYTRFTRDWSSDVCSTDLMLQQEIDEYYANFRVSNNLLELRNLVQVAELIVRCAMMRKESRGLHYTLDYPEPLEMSRSEERRAGKDRRMQCQQSL